jgi:dihydropyrimidinase
MHDNMEFTPYEGMVLTGWPTTVIQRGDVIIQGNELKADRGAGNFVPRKTIDCTGMPGKLAPELDPALNFGVELGL